MKKTVKIIAVILLCAIAIFSLFTTIKSAISAYELMNYYLYWIDLYGCFENIPYDYSIAVSSEKQMAVSNALISLYSLFNFILSTILVVLILVLSYKRVSVSEKIRIIKSDITIKWKERKEKNKQKKIAEMKSKIEKMESDE